MGISEGIDQVFAEYPAYTPGQGIGKDEQVWSTFEELRNAIATSDPVRKSNTVKVTFSLGKGRLTAVPWVALLDSRETNSTQSGTYIVLLFREDMSGVYLCLSQGVTEHQETSSTIAAESLQRKRELIKPHCTFLVRHGFELEEPVDLRSSKSKRSKLYEVGTVAHKFYGKGEVPNDDQIEDDLRRLMHAYDQLLEAKLSGKKEPQRTEDVNQVWIFQANPDKYEYRIPTVLNRQNEIVDWRVSRYRNRIKKGDTVLTWKSGREAGIYGLAKVIEEPKQLALDGEVDGERDSWAARLEYRNVFREGISRDVIKENEILKDLLILRQPNATNYPVTPPQWKEICRLLPDHALLGLSTKSHDFYIEPSFYDVVELIRASGMIFTTDLLKRYHAALRTRNFVILSGISGSGKTSLAEYYARAVQANWKIISVAPNWSCDEDLLGYYNPLVDRFQFTKFSEFVEAAAKNYNEAQSSDTAARPFHVILDEMNLAHVEYYFAKFLSAMELRSRHGTASIDLQAGHKLTLTPNLFFVGTVNVDETTQMFSDKVFDRAQLIEVSHSRTEIELGIRTPALRTPILELWDVLCGVKPFSFRVIADMEEYARQSNRIGVSIEESMDHQISQKLLPKLKGFDPELADVLRDLSMLCKDRYPESFSKLARMIKKHESSAITSFF